jgi:NADH-quinone oxidoreductase subunit L
MSATTAGWLVLLCPIVGLLINALFGRALPGKTPAWIATAAIGLSFVFAIVALLDLESRPEDARQLTSTLFDYANTVGVDAQLTILIDPLSVYMMLVVAGVSTMIHLYSLAYMWTDRGYVRFFAYLNYFVFSMLLLVEAGNFLLLIIGWAFVGAASYLLISFWYRRTTATTAGIKAFVINVGGDVGLVLGTYFIFKSTGTLDFVQTFEQVDTAFTQNDGELIAGLILLMVGAFAKSAQVPLHTWLPDAMEGPTPVSALIHAATMVTAGVYLIARMEPLFTRAPDAGMVGAFIGAITLLIAATIALTQTDLKRVIAYSTMSQIGYMIMAVSAGAYVGGMFHLLTHAFFKALLFMGAGSIISAMANIQNLDRMGGFRRAMPFTFACFIIGGLALSGFPPFAGFFSKDDLLLELGELGGYRWALYVAGYLGAFLTAIYTFRMIFRAFFGEPVPEAKEFEEGGMHHGPGINPGTLEEEDPDVGFPGPEHHTAERAWPMKLAMTVLAIGATFLGFLQIPFTDVQVVEHFLEPAFEGAKFPETNETLEAFGLIAGTLLAAAGIGIAYLIYVRKIVDPAKLRARFKPLYELSFHKWWFDELYDHTIVRPAAATGRFARQTFERVIVDGLLVGGATGLVRAGSAAVRAAQSGFLRYYAALLLFGVAGLALWFLILSS